MPCNRSDARRRMTMGGTRSRGSRGFQCSVGLLRPGEPSRYVDDVMRHEHEN